MKEEEFKKTLSKLFSVEKQHPFKAIKEAYRIKENEVLFYKKEFGKTKNAFKRIYALIKDKELIINELKSEIEILNNEKEKSKLRFEEKIVELKKALDIQKMNFEKSILNLKESFEEKEGIYEREKEKILSFESERRHLVERLASTLSELQRLKNEEISKECT